MTVTVPKIRNAAAMDVDISVWFHIKVFASVFFLVIIQSLVFLSCVLYVSRT